MAREDKLDKQTALNSRDNLDIQTLERDIADTDLILQKIVE
jgi:hypothetical protein